MPRPRCEPFGLDRLGRIVAALAEILRLDVADVQEAVAADAEIDERRLDAGLEIDDSAFVDVADVVVLAGAFDVQLFQHAVLDDRDPAFFGLRHVDQHFLLHAVTFSIGMLPCAALVRGGSQRNERRSYSWFQHHLGAGKVKPCSRKSSRPRAASTSRATSYARATRADSKSQYAGLDVGRDQQVAQVHRRSIRAADRQTSAGRANAPRGGPPSSTAFGRQRDLVGKLATAAARRCRRSSRHVGHNQAGRCPLQQALAQSSSTVCGPVEVHLDQLVMAILSHRQRRRKIDPRARMAPFGHDQSHLRAAQQTLPRAQQIEVTNPAQVTLFAKSNAYSSSNHQLTVSRAADARNACLFSRRDLLAAIGPHASIRQIGQYFLQLLSQITRHVAGVFQASMARSATARHWSIVTLRQTRLISGMAAAATLICRNPKPNKQHRVRGIRAHLAAQD